MTTPATDTTPTLSARFLSQLPTQPLHWFWQDRIPLGQLTLLEGPPGIGTSLLALHLAACATSGQPLPDGSPCHRGGVVLLSAFENPADTIIPRLQAAGGDPNQVVLLRTLPTASP